jgi:hypothetical protein
MMKKRHLGTSNDPPEHFDSQQFPEDTVGSASGDVKRNQAAVRRRHPFGEGYSA